MHINFMPGGRSGGGRSGGGRSRGHSSTSTKSNTSGHSSNTSTKPHADSHNKPKEKPIENNSTSSGTSGNILPGLALMGFGAYIENRRSEQSHSQDRANCAKLQHQLDECLSANSNDPSQCQAQFELYNYCLSNPNGFHSN